MRQRAAPIGFFDATLEVEGDSRLEAEAGGHRIQRIPPTERRGRVHTSTCTVAVLGKAAEADPRYLMRADGDFRVEWFSGTGKGGQHRNKHQNCCRLFHNPTGIKKEAQTRSRESSLREARAAMIAELDRRIAGEQEAVLSDTRRGQMGSGMRGDKVRTYRFQDDVVKDHRTGRTASCEKMMRGNMDAIWG